MHEQRNLHKIGLLCFVLEVSRAGYYKWTNRMPSNRTKTKERLLTRILSVFEQSRETYGCPRVYQSLRKNGVAVNHKTVERLMREHEITPIRKRKYKSTTDSKHNLPISPNILSREFEVQELDEVWVGDITYVETKEGWLYVATTIDLFSRQVVGWSASANMTSELVLSAFQNACSSRQRAPVLFHSDRGSQYASVLFRNELTANSTLQSMSRKGNCWDNAVAESFFGSLKSELVYRNTFDTRKQAELMVFEYIEIFYNKQRLHSGLNYLTPEEKAQKGKKAA